MGDIGPFLVPISLFISIASVLILRGPLGKALGERVAGRAVESSDGGNSEALHAELDELRFRLQEVEERLDFTERMLAQQPGRDALPPE